MSKTSTNRLTLKIGVEMLALRQKKGWTQVEASKKIGMPQSTLCVIELANESPRMDTIERIARAYGVLAVFGDGGPVFRARPDLPGDG